MGIYYGEETYAVRVVEVIETNENIVQTVHFLFDQDHSSITPEIQLQYMNLEHKPNYLYEIYVDFVCGMEFPSDASKTWILSDKATVDKYLGVDSK